MPVFCCINAITSGDLKKINELSSIEDKNIFYEAVFKKENILKVFNEIKDNESFNFNQLIDITAIDYPSREKRFEIIYILLSMKKNKRIVLKTSINTDKLNVTSINSAGRNKATCTLIRRMPSRTSSGVMVSPRPTETVKALSGEDPANPPRFHIPVKKLVIMPFIVIHVLGVLPSNT